jgi:hypothetical protein
VHISPAGAEKNRQNIVYIAQYRKFCGRISPESTGVAAVHVSSSFYPIRFMYRPSRGITLWKVLFIAYFLVVTSKNRASETRRALLITLQGQ